MSGSFMDRFIAYVDLLEEGFAERVRPLDPKVLAEFEELYGGPLPAEYRAYLERMGGDSGGFALFNDEELPLWTVLAFYRPNPKRDFEPPRDGSILIARGGEIHLALDGRKPPARPVAAWDTYEFQRCADSLEAYLFQQAWWQYAKKGLADPRGAEVRGGEPVFTQAVEATRRRGFRLLDFSDSAQRIFEGNGRAVFVQLRDNGEVFIHARAPTEEQASALAREIAAESGGKPI